MSILLKSLSPEKDAVLVTIVAPKLIQELWESRNWVNPRVFLKAAQATLACLAVQGLGEEDSKESIEMQWAWNNDEGLSSLYSDSLFQGVVRTSFAWRGEAGEDTGILQGNFQLRRSYKLGGDVEVEGVPVRSVETSGIVDSGGDIVCDVQDYLLKSEQRDCALAISVRWTIDESDKLPVVKITTAHAYLLHVLPPPLESQRDDVLARWHGFLRSLSTPAEWVLSPEPETAVQEMTNFVFASPRGMQLFKRDVMFFCNCTREKVLKIMKVLSPEDIASLDEVIEVSCKYCGKVYRLDKSGLA